MNGLPDPKPGFDRPPDGRLSDAEQAARDILKANPHEPHATLLLGIITCKQRKYAESEELLRRSVAIDPRSFHARMWLAIALRHQDRFEEAVASAEQAAAQKPDDPDAHYQLGLCCLELGRFEDAEQALLQAVTLDPSKAKYYEAYGRALHGLDRYAEAVQALRRAAVLDGSNENIFYRLGSVLLERFDGQGAADCADRILKLNPDSRPGRLLLASALFADQKGDEAVTAVLRLVDQEPDWDLAALSAGRILQGVGRFTEAKEFFRRSLEINPGQGQAYLGLVQGRPVKPEETELIGRMEGLAASDTTPLEDLISLNFALGKSYDDLAKYEKAMAYFDKANELERRLRFRGRRFDHEGMAKTGKRIREILTDAFLTKHGEAGLQDETPILVVGMMRSGTTLIDQILSSHPEIGTVGEQQFWQANQNYALNLQSGTLDSEKLNELATRYLAILREQGKDKQRIVDKMPGNYAVLGLIHLALPKARVIHVSRHPVDTCISIYTTPNTSTVEWAHEKGDIVFAYQEYLRFMRHWRQVLPNRQILEVHYEELVRHPEETTRKLIEFTGLEWSESCLKPEQNPRTVTTPSGWQVRQPIHNGSLDRWRNYESWLGEFTELLDRGERQIGRLRAPPLEFLTRSSE